MSVSHDFRLRTLDSFITRQPHTITSSFSDTASIAFCTQIVTGTSATNSRRPWAPPRHRLPPQPRTTIAFLATTKDGDSHDNSSSHRLAHLRRAREDTGNDNGAVCNVYDYPSSPTQIEDDGDTSHPLREALSGAHLTPGTPQQTSSCRAVRFHSPGRRDTRLSPSRRQSPGNSYSIRSLYSRSSAPLRITKGIDCLRLLRHRRPTIKRSSPRAWLLPVLRERDSSTAPHGLKPRARMSGLLERGRLTTLEHATRPVLSRKSSPGKTALSLTYAAPHVEPNELDAATPHKPPHPTTTEDERVWRDGQDAMTYNAWLSKEKELDDAFRIWRNTEDGRRGVAEVYNRFPGLRLTSMGVEDVPWFVREMSTLGTYLRKTWDAASSDGNTKPRFCVAQLMLLMLLMSPQRSLCIDGMGEKSEELFPFYREAPWWGKLYGDFYVGGSGLTDGYDCLFPTGVISKAKFSDGLRDRRLPQAVEGITRLFRLAKRVCSQRTAIAISRCTAMHRHTSR